MDRGTIYNTLNCAFLQALLPYSALCICSRLRLSKSAVWCNLWSADMWTKYCIFIFTLIVYAIYTFCLHDSQICTTFAPLFWETTKKCVKPKPNYSEDEREIIYIIIYYGGNGITLVHGRLQRAPLLRLLHWCSLRIVLPHASVTILTVPIKPTLT